MLYRLLEVLFEVLLHCGVCISVVITSWWTLCILISLILLIYGLFVSDYIFIEFSHSHSDRIEV